MGSRRGSCSDLGAADHALAAPPAAKMSEQQRIEEYAGKRALLRLEQELDAPRDGHGDGGFKSVMDRRKLARVPQARKADLVIGEYLGRGNFCDVFEVTWVPPEQQALAASHDCSVSNLSNRTRSDSDGDSCSQECSRSEASSLAASLQSLALSRSNDLSLIRDERRGASRRSVSQVAAASDPRGGGGGVSRNPNVLALKCLRPAVRAQPRKFVIGAEDLAHETALLACVDHPNIIQLHGRAEGCFSTAFQMRSKKSGRGEAPEPEGKPGAGKRMSDEGYFIILDRLVTTLTDRIDEWRDECRAINGVAPRDAATGARRRVDPPPEATLREHLARRLKVAYCIADALEYLHSRHVVFRDLKPANVGFDVNDCVKVFDFGFATSIAPLLAKPYDGYGPLTETCGTRRYMAPEVALKLGYGKEVDVYGFGMLLWEICALEKPFDGIQSVDEFHDLVVLCGRRPSLRMDALWTASLRGLMGRCWSTDPLDRPNMGEVKSALCDVLRDMNRATEGRKAGGGRLTGGGGTAATAGKNGGANKGVTPAQKQEQGGNFIHKCRRRLSI